MFGLRDLRTQIRLDFCYTPGFVKIRALGTPFVTDVFVSSAYTPHHPSLKPPLEHKQSILNTWTDDSRLHVRLTRQRLRRSHRLCPVSLRLYLCTHLLLPWSLFRVILGVPGLSSLPSPIFSLPTLGRRSCFTRLRS